MSDAYRKAAIYVRNEYAGIIKETELGYSFRYDTRYLDKPHALHASITLPLSGNEYESSVLFPFFDGLIPEGCSLPVRDGRFLTDGHAQVLLSHGGSPDLTRNAFGKGSAFYLSGYSYSPENTRLLLNLIAAGAGSKPSDLLYVSDNPDVDCAWFPAGKKLVAVNLTARPQTAQVRTETGSVEISLPESGQIILQL